MKTWARYRATAAAGTTAALLLAATPAHAQEHDAKWDLAPMVEQSLPHWEVPKAKDGRVEWKPAQIVAPVAEPPRAPDPGAATLADSQKPVLPAANSTNEKQSTTYAERPLERTTGKPAQNPATPDTQLADTKALGRSTAPVLEWEVQQMTPEPPAPTLAAGPMVEINAETRDTGTTALNTATGESTNEQSAKTDPEERNAGNTQELGPKAAIAANGNATGDNDDERMETETTKTEVKIAGTGEESTIRIVRMTAVDDDEAAKDDERGDETATEEHTVHSPGDGEQDEGEHKAEGTSPQESAAEPLDTEQNEPSADAILADSADLPGTQEAEPEPACTVSAVKERHIDRGESIEQAITRWAQADGWRMLVRTRTDWIADVEDSHTASLAETLERVMIARARDRPAPRVILSGASCTLRLTDSES